MASAEADFLSDMIDLNGLSLRDLDKLPESSFAIALRGVLTSNDAGPSAGFSSSLKDAETVAPSPLA